MNYFDILLAKKLEDDRDPKVEGLSVTENGRYHEDGVVYDPVIVEVPEPTLISKSITANGDYSASADNADGYSSVSINVPLPSNAYLLQSIEHEQVATFTDGTDNFVKSLEVAIEPVQSGSGEPSPSNIRPISGWDECKVTRCGKNLYDGVSNIMLDKPVPYGTKIYIQVFEGTFAGATLYGKSYDTDFIALGSFNRTKNVITIRRNDITQIKISPSALNDLRVYGSKLMVSFTDFETYEPYNGQTYTINFVDGSSPLTVYGGTLNVLSGLLTITDGYISSYNGETLPSTWISDRDVYAEGTTPTIGAEVVYELATPIEVQLTPTLIKSLQGDNNFFASTGEVIKLQYWGKEQN